MAQREAGHGNESDGDEAVHGCPSIRLQLSELWKLLLNHDKSGAAERFCSAPIRCIGPRTEQNAATLSCVIVYADKE